MTAADDASRDPGWPSVGVFLTLLIPGMLQREARRSHDGLFGARMVFISFFNAIVLIGVVVLVMGLDGRGTAWPWLVALGVAAVASIVVTNVVDRPLDCTSPATLASSYRTRFFLRIAFAEPVALLGFVASIASQNAWIYLPAAAFTLYRFWTVAAPTRDALVADQRALKARGCQLSLVAALRTTPPPTPRGRRG